ncbi:MAG TPA: SPOR domain-containing protein [Candidatus Binatia bacterium]|nr:SPOR domain-containing protein [Candidatus Binatia bacterium]
MIANRFPKAWILALGLAVLGCNLVDDPPRKSGMSGLIVTPPSYYSTPKGRFLGAKYRENLDRLVESIVRNPTTAKLQFANNIASVGGIGFFSHGATKTPDERYLEVILGAPEVFEYKGNYSAKVNHIFSLYGRDLLGILAGDPGIEQETEVSGYGLNFSWRNVGSKESASGVFLERTVVYFPKEKVWAFLRQQINPNDLLGDSTIFAAEQDGPMNLVSYQAQGTISTARSSAEQPAIAEPKLAAAVSPQPVIVETPLNAQEVEPSSRQLSGTKAQAAPTKPHSEKVVKEKTAVAAIPGAEQKSASATTKAAVVGTAPVKRAAESRTTEKVVVVNTERKISQVRPAPATETEPKDSEKIAAEPVASARVKQTAPAPEKKTSARPIAKNLEGFVIQLAFTEANAAQHWAKTLEQRGYTVSITEAGGDASFRVRMGNFALREEADRQLRSLRQEGLSGIVINLPQAYRPEVRSASPPTTDNPVSIAQ